MRNNRAEYNVAGIEIENTTNADVYDNVAVNNTGGILVFNMPDLPAPGHTTRVYNNEIRANNTPNFAPEGTAVASVPTGSGVLINSNDRVEVFGNQIADNQTANVIISSYFSNGYEREQAEAYDPYPETIYIHGNTFSGGGDAPGREELDALRVAVFGEDGRFPDVIWDGFVNPELTTDGVNHKPEHAICIDNGDAQILNVDGPNQYQSPTVDAPVHRCKHQPLPSVSLELAS